MKKILAFLVAGLMILSFAACNKNNKPTENDNPGTSKTGDDWMAAYNMKDLAVPEGATVSSPIAYDNMKRDIDRDTKFTEAEVEAFAQSVLENCNAPYKSKYDADKDEYVRLELTDAEDAKGLDEYGWKYEEDGKTYSIRIYFGIENKIGFEKYQSS